MIAEAIDIPVDDAITEWKADPNLYAAPSLTSRPRAYPQPRKVKIYDQGKRRRSVFELIQQATGATGPANLLRVPALPMLRVWGGQQLIAELQPDDSEVGNLNGHVVSQYLITRSIMPDRTHEVADGTVIIEYLRHGFASVDVYPNGDVILIIANGDADDIYEFDLRELPKVANLLRDAGFAG